MITLHRAVLYVALANLTYFGVEFAVALHIHSVALFADSVDFLEDASINLLIFIALGWTVVARARVGMVLAGLLLWPALATLWMLWHKIASPITPDAFSLFLTATGALVVNLSCAFLLARFRNAQGSLTKAAFFSARNDALANIGIIGAAAITYMQPTQWPDIIVGIIIAIINADAAKEVWEAARKEQLEHRI